MIISSRKELEEEIKRFDDIPGLSSVYKDGKAYGVAYYDVHGSIELLSGSFTTPEYALACARQKYPDMTHPLLVVELTVGAVKYKIK